MTGLKELIEQELDQYLEWPTADKSHVTTVSAKLFAEHVAQLYADHFRDAGKMAAPDVQGEPVAYWDGDTVEEGTAFQFKRDSIYKIPLYAHPQPAPDVSALVEALELAQGFLRNKGCSEEDPLLLGAINAALAAHRQQEGEA